MPQTTRRRPDGRLILLLGALAACGPLSIDMYLPSLPSLAVAFSTSAAAAQSTLTSFMAGFSIGMLLYGPLSDAYGRRPILLGGIALYTVASIACAVAFSIDALIFVRFLQALGAGAASVLARAIARDAHEPTDAARVLSMLSIVTSIGPLLAPLIGGQLLLLGGWRVVFMALTLFGAVCAVTAFLRVPETWPREKRASSAVGRSFAAYGRLLTDPVTWGHMLCGGMAFASMFAYITATPFVYIDYFHVKPQHYGLLFGLNIIGIITRERAEYAVCRQCRFAADDLGRGVRQRGRGPGGRARVPDGLGRAVVDRRVLVFRGRRGGLLSANCTTDLMHRYPHNAGAAAALFGAMQLALGALASLAIGLFHDGSPRGMGIVIGVCGLLTYRRAHPGIALARDAGAGGLNSAPPTRIVKGCVSTRLHQEPRNLNGAAARISRAQAP